MSIEVNTSILPPELVAKLGIMSPTESSTQAGNDGAGAETKKVEPKSSKAEDITSPPSIPSPPPIDGSKFSKDELNAYIKTLTHDQLKEFEAYNAHVSRAQSKVQEDHKRAVQIQTKLLEWDHYFSSIPKDRLADDREDDKVDAMYRAVKKWRAEGRAVPGLIGAQAHAADTTAISKKLKDYYQSHPDWANIVTEELWSELAAENDPSQMLIMLSDARVNALTKAGHERFEDEVKAGVEAALAAQHKGVTAPQKPKGAAAATGKGLTIEEYRRMSPKEARELTAEQIDQLTREVRDGTYGA